MAIKIPQSTQQTKAGGNLSGIDTTLLVVKTTKNEVFGAFATSIWEEKPEATFFGRGDTFLYRIPLSGGPEASKFTWSRENGQFRALQPPLSRIQLLIEITLRNLFPPQCVALC